MTTSSSAKSGNVLKMALGGVAAAIGMAASNSLVTDPDSHRSAELQAFACITLVALPSLHELSISLPLKSVAAGRISKS
ncbi:hypothetical protein [Candidatus Accumulibacter sp. ACC007]|uniref:hypothetical protein n=1 Tax=Candidatus Accumulibacter sp. ACC007 TaxID=2823333 RepID=UPI0025BBD398|nr:hypothetical protein [Candidatus Accumulibacter sp. ACC007]